MIRSTSYSDINAKAKEQEELEKQKNEFFSRGGEIAHFESGESAIHITPMRKKKKYGKNSSEHQYY